MMTATEMDMSGTPRTDYSGLKHVATAARDSVDYRVRLGQEHEAVLALIVDHESLRQQIAPAASPEPESPVVPLEPRKRVPTIFPRSPAAERHREEMRQLIRSAGLAMETRPDGLIHITGADVDLLVRDLVNVIPSDFNQARY